MIYILGLAQCKMIKVVCLEVVKWLSRLCMGHREVTSDFMWQGCLKEFSGFEIFDSGMFLGTLLVVLWRKYNQFVSGNFYYSNTPHGDFKRINFCPGISLGFVRSPRYSFVFWFLPPFVIPVTWNLEYPLPLEQGPKYRYILLGRVCSKWQTQSSY